METDEKIAIACGIFLIFAIFAGIYLSARFGGDECDGLECAPPAPAFDTGKPSLGEMGISARGGVRLKRARAQLSRNR